MKQSAGPAAGGTPTPEESRPIDPAEVAYRMSFAPHPEPVRVVYNGVDVAESARVMVLRETRLAPVFYFARDDVRVDLMTRTERVTHCPFKGNATYWTLEVGDRHAENAVWGYEDPIADVGNLRDYIAFYWSGMDAWYVGGERVLEPETDSEVVRANPLVEWLLRDAAELADARALAGGLCECLRTAGISLVHLRVLVRTLHPQVFATAYTWRREKGEVEEGRLSHDVLRSEELLRSPYAPILDGAGGVRRRLAGPHAELDFPILRELREQGATDYIAMPLLFSDGQINILSLASDRPGGFRTEDLGLIHEIMPVLSRLFEVHALRSTATTLLETYIGRHTGARVLDGKIRRGDGETLHAVIWLCDLRDSTRLATALGRERYLELLNDFFDATAGSVLDRGGEVLKFIGDAVLAIFPIVDREDSGTAARGALAAAREARSRVATHNREREARDEPSFDFGVGLHRGDLTYGNIGTPGRLDFTVIGEATNEAARIEAMCKPLERWILASSRFAAALPGEFVSLGKHSLRGVADEFELFTLPG